MKNNSFKLLFAVLLLLSSTVSMAELVNVGNIMYDISTDKKTATVMHFSLIYDSSKKSFEEHGRECKEYSGDIVIPKSVEYNGFVYKVTAIGDAAFFLCHKITEITIPNSVTSIGELAFRGCKLTEIILPNSVRSIGNLAFCDCFLLKHIKLPNSMTRIGEGAFWNCMELENIVIPKKLKVIEESTFGNCAKLDNVIIPKRVKVIDVKAFTGCTALKSIELPKGITCISDSVFRGCVSLENITLPNEVESIGKSAFQYCRAIKKINIPVGVTSIGKYAFLGCKSLAKIELPVGISCIEPHMFSYCISLKEITIPNGVERIGRAFFCCDSLSRIKIPASVLEIDDACFVGCHAVRDVVYDCNVKCNRLLSGCKLKNVTIGSNVNLDAYDLANIFSRNEIETITVVAGNERYDSRNGCNAIIERLTNKLVLGCKNSVIPFGIKEIDSYAFRNCIGLVSITIPNSVESISYDAFRGSRDLTTIFIPESVRYISDGAFEGCSALECITVAEGNTRYDSREDCNAIIETASNELVAGCKNTIIPEGIRIISSHAFEGHTGLTGITIPNSVIRIEYSAFNRCTNLSRIEIPASVIILDNNVFKGCPSLERIVVAEGNNVYDSREGCNAIIETATNKLVSGCKATVIPNSVTKIGDSAFSGCIRNDATFSDSICMEIPENVESLGNFAFSGCSGLFDVKIPNSIRIIPRYSFAGVKSITVPESVVYIESPLEIEHVNMLSSIPPICEGNLYDGDKCTLYVPFGSKDAYQSVAPWNLYKNIVERQVE